MKLLKKEKVIIPDVIIVIVACVNVMDCVIRKGL